MNATAPQANARVANERVANERAADERAVNEVAAIGRSPNDRPADAKPDDRSDPRSRPSVAPEDSIADCDLHGSICVIRPRVALRRDSADELADLARRAIAMSPMVVVDLSIVPLIDGKGLEWMLDLDDMAADSGGCVRLCHASDLCSDLLRISGVGARLTQTGTLAEALADLAC